MVFYFLQACNKLKTAGEEYYSVELPDYFGGRGNVVVVYSIKRGIVPKNIEIYHSSGVTYNSAYSHPMSDNPLL